MPCLDIERIVALAAWPLEGFLRPRAAEAALGGAFRCDDDDGLARILAGRRWVACLPSGGRRLLHRIAEVEGRRSTAAPCHRDRPGMTDGPGVRTLFYGRSEALSPPA